MVKEMRITIALLAISLLNASHAWAVPLAYMISIDSRSLRSIDLAIPGTVTTVGNFSGATTSLSGLDFRPANGLLYGYSAGSNSLVVVNPINAFTTFVSNPSTASTTSTLGVDFNPAADRLRLVNLDDQNLRINVDTGATIVDTPLAYAAGDPNFGVNPNIIEAAYTNSDVNPATGTSLYYIDSVLDTLVTTTNPNGGVLNTVGSLGVNTTNLVGFDILSNGFGGNTAYATMLLANGASNFYQINLATGAATSLGTLGNGQQISFGLAIVQPTIPEPSSAMIAVGLLTFGLYRRSRAV